MKPLKLGLIAAMALALAAPATSSFSQAKKDKAAAAAGAIGEKERQKGMAEAPALAQQAGLTCQVADARFIGEVNDKAAKTKKAYYEVDCDQGLGFLLESTAGAKPSIFTCIEANTPGPDGKQSSLACRLPGNANPEGEIAKFVQKAGLACNVEKVRGIGQTTSKAIFEVLCQGGSGYVLSTSLPPVASATVEANSCLLIDENPGNVACTLADKAARLAVVEPLVQQAGISCTVKDKRFVMMTKDNSTYFETACQDGKGYMIKADAAGKASAIECARAEHVDGGCRLTDARAAMTELTALYTRLSKAANYPCEVKSYGALPAGGGKDVVELVCANGPGGIGVFDAAGKGTVYNCGVSQIAGYRCALNKGDTGAQALSAELKKLGKANCTVKESRFVGKTTDGNAYVEVNCTDGLAGYMIQYSSQTVTPKEAIGCAFAKGIGGGCKLPGNTG